MCPSFTPCELLRREKAFDAVGSNCGAYVCPELPSVIRSALLPVPSFTFLFCGDHIVIGCACRAAFAFFRSADDMTPTGKRRRVAGGKRILQLAINLVIGMFHFSALAFAAALFFGSVPTTFSDRCGNLTCVPSIVSAPSSSALRVYTSITVKLMKRCVELLRGTRVQIWPFGRQTHATWR